MLSLSEEITLKKRGITIEKIEEQLACFSTGFPFLEIRSAAEPGKGILVIKEGEIPVLLNQWEEYRYTNASIVKFVPASGAASRMFKDLFGFLEGKTNKPNSDFEKKFFTEIKKFAFFDDLDKICRKNNEKSIDKLIEDKQFKTIVENLLYDKGLNYGSLPKGLLKFHSYPTEKRTPMQEHMVEGAMYSADASGKVNIHFTVSKEHRALFEKHLQETIEEYQKKYKIIYNVSFSEQKPSTDTIAADENNQPFRDKGELVFRPGGHGALIENLNDLNSDIVFIKNIDNVVPDWLKDSTVTYKKVIAGILIHLQKQCFAYLNELEKVSISDAKLKIIAQFCEVRLNNYNADLHLLSHKELRVYLINN
jgi:hypothetical protein